ncbi:MAG: hypothetical protein UX17_C0006G0007 [Parcubacteria group bacterium GW2011_GWC2_45_7]|nr:MAG: hypothetical protein UX17_C0006G0007 [Parcubacteria group bacterium GW2011_GWC2_45_7]
MTQDTGCCGAHFRKDIATFFGLMTFSMPVIVLCGIALPILFVMGKIHPPARKIQKQIFAILKANLRLIYAVPLHPKARCISAGRMFPYSSRFSGAVYRCFNFGILILAWLGIIFCLYSIGTFIGT